MNNDQYTTLFPPPPLSMTYWTGDLQYIENEIKKYQFQKNSGNSISTVNRFLDDPTFIDLRNFILNFIHRYTVKVFRTRQKIKLTQSWITITNKGENHPRHSHSNSYLSGVMFIKSVTGSSPLTFENHLRPQQLYVNLHDGGDPSLPPNEFRNCDIAMEYIDPIPGRILLFPAPSPHFVPRSDSKSERITLAFNTWPTRPFGKEGDVTQVY